MTAYWITGDARAVLAELQPDTVDLVLTSPPFLALRSYLPDDDADKVHEIGSEANPAEFIDTLLDLTEAFGRVLAPHGSIAVELGDTYAGGGVFGWPLPKSLALVPEAYRFALAYGRNPFNGRTTERWRVRNVVRWVRPNPPVGALGDKFRPATSDLVIACKAVDRWFDLDAVRTAPTKKPQRHLTPNDLRSGRTPKERREQLGDYTTDEVATRSNPAGAPPLDWWAITPGGYPGAHYAVYPPELCVRPIEAMCPRRVCRTCGRPSRRSVDIASHGEWRRPELEHTRANHGGPGTHGHRARDATTTGWSSCGCPGTDGIRLDGYHTGTGWRPGMVLDPFGGSGTTAAVATGHSRDCISIDLDRRNLDLARDRIGMWLVEATAAQLAEMAA